MLTDAKIKSLKADEKRYRVSDSGGLYVEVQPSGTKYMRLNYRFLGKARTHTLGVFPELKLAEARYLREDIKRKAREGRDPHPPRAAAPAKPEPEPEAQAEPTPAVEDPLTWRSYARRYLDKREREGAAQKTLAKLRGWEVKTSEVMGDMLIHEIGAKPVIEACSRYEEEGKLTSANGMRSFCSQVFRFAIAHGDANFDPAYAARDAVALRPSGGYPGITRPRRVGELMNAVRQYDGDQVVRLGLLLLAYTFPRSGELRRMEWGQIKGDTWTAPPEIMKMDREHIVPLPKQALKVLKQLRSITGKERYVLQSRRASSGLISENTFNKALVMAGIPKVCVVR